MAASGTVVVNGSTRLERIGEVGEVTRFAEVYYGWKTGNVFEFPSSLSASDVAEAFRGATPSGVLQS